MKPTDAEKHNLIWLKTQLRLHQIVLAQIVSDLPVKHEWIDLAVERNARQLLKTNYQPIPESEYWKAIRTGIKPAIWPPITMTREELNHFRETHGLKT